MHQNWILRNSWRWPAQWPDGEAAKHFQSHTCTKKGPGHCSVVSCRPGHYSFLNPGETIPSEKYTQQIGEMHWKPQCLQLALVLREGPILSIQHSLRVEQIGPHSCLFCHIHLNSHHPTTTSSILTTFCRENTFTTSRRQKMLSQSSRNPEAQIFRFWGINKVIFCGQKCVDCTGSCFD